MSILTSSKSRVVRRIAHSCNAPLLLVTMPESLRDNLLRGIFLLVHSLVFIAMLLPRLLRLQSGRWLPESMQQVGPPLGVGKLSHTDIRAQHCDRAPHGKARRHSRPSKPTAAKPVAKKASRSSFMLKAFAWSTSSTSSTSCPSAVEDCENLCHAELQQAWEASVKAAIAAQAGNIADCIDDGARSGSPTSDASIEATWDAKSDVPGAPLMAYTPADYPGWGGLAQPSPAAVAAAAAARAKRAARSPAHQRPIDRAIIT